MNCSKPCKSRLLPLLTAPLLLIGCASTPPAAPPLIVQCPTPTPLPAAISRITPQPSTASLQRASQWSESSRALLDSVTQKSQP